MNKILNKKIQNNKGMSIVTVIVAIGFVAILVSIIMMASVVNFKMKSVNVYAKDSFYSAEQVLDEINVGLQQWVSDGLSYAYSEVMTKYTSEDLTPTDKNNMVRAAYFQYMWDKLGGGTAISYKDPVSKKTLYKYIAQPTDNSNVGLYGLLKESTQWHASTDIDETYGAFLRSTESDSSYYSGVIKTYEDKGLVLEDLTVYYKDPNGFVSAIKTDIRIGYPEFAFSDAEMPDIANYVFITDTAFVQSNSGVDKSGAVSTAITGNTYAYAVDVTGSKIENKAVENDVDMHIVATNLGVTNGGFTTNANSTLWTRDIEAKSSDLSLAGQSYVYDDLNIKGKNSNIALKGYYTGFGNSTTSSRESSAILVNGVNTTIDIRNIRKLTLAGRAYIGTSDANGKVGRVSETSDDADPGADDVYTGESIAVKSDQLMYLVPGDCIGVELDEDNKPGASMYGKNPLTLSEYNTIMGKINNGDGKKYIEVAGNKPIKKLLGNTDTADETTLSGFYLGNYVKTDSSGNPKVEKVFMRAANGTDRLVYYYMTFVSEQKANEYFAKYYNQNKTSVDKYLKQYLNSITMPDSSVISFRVDMAALAYNSPEEGVYELSNNVRVPTGERTISEDFAESFEDYSKQYLAYCSTLKSDYDEVADSANADILRTGFPEYDPKNKKMKIAEKDSDGSYVSGGVTYNDNYYTVFKNLINEEVLKEIVGGSSGTLTLDGPEGKVLLIYDTNVDSVHNVGSDYKLIIANCGVNLTGSTFKGCILAKGIIKTPSGNVSLTHDPEAVGSCLLYETEDQVYKVSDVFGDLDSGSYSSALKGTGDTVTTASLITYENWTKNVNIK